MNIKMRIKQEILHNMKPINRLGEHLIEQEHAQIHGYCYTSMAHQSQKRISQKANQDKKRF